MVLKIEINLTTEEQNDNIYNVRYAWVVLYKDEYHNQTGPDYEVAFVCDEEYKAIRYTSQFAPEYVKNHFKVVKTKLY